MMNRTFSTMMASAVVLGSLMVGCSAGHDHPKFASSEPQAFAPKVERMLADKDYAQAMTAAEQMVTADPRNGNARALLARTYLANGRYISARMAFTDAMTLGNREPRTIVSLALVQSGLGDLEAAHTLLNDHIGDLPAGDYGLAMTMTGDAREGVRALLEAVHAPDATVKTRQNLAYALAMGGAWGQARLIAGQDLPGREAEARIGEWTQTFSKSSPAERVVAMIGVAPRTDDAGLPVQLALNAVPAQQAQLAVADEPAPKADAVPEAPKTVAVAVAAPVPAPSPVIAKADMNAKPAFAPQALAAVLAKPPVGPIAITADEPIETVDRGKSADDSASAASAVKATFRTAPAAAMPFAKPAVTAPSQATLKAAFAPKAAVEGPTRSAKFATPRLDAPIADGKASNWVVQLGAFDSDALARQQWTKLSQTRDMLKPYQAVHSTLALNGRTFYRLAIRGFGDRGAAVGACSTLRGAGQPCFVRLDDSGKPQVTKTVASR